MKNKFWNKDHEKNFRYVLERYAGKSDLQFLEIGTYKGETAQWLYDNLLNGSALSRLTCIDPCPDPKFASKMEKVKDPSFSSVVKFRKQKSQVVLPEFIMGRRKFDFIYVDGDHHASSALQDLVMSWKLLKEGGLLLIDDYEMEARDPWFYKSHPEFGENPRLNFIHPRVAIDAFLSVYRGQYEKVIDNYQVGLIKICGIGE